MAALTPWQKWSAARGMGADGGAGLQKWFTIVLVAILIVLFVMLIKISFNRLQQERQRSERQFLENVRRRNLSVREFHLLQQVIKRGGVRRHDQIFQDLDAFEKGTAHVIAEVVKEQGPQWHARILAEIDFLREKMGFKTQGLTEVLPAKKTKGPRKLTTRDIPLGKSISITRRFGRMSDEIQALIVDNTPQHLVITLNKQVKVTFGELWRAHYHFGASVWEFDTSVLSFDGERLILQHSDDVRFINRRRFVRVPARNLAFISRFPFQRHVGPAGDLLLDPQSAQDDWKPLEFVHATVTELAGPGLRVEASLALNVGERILIILRLDDQCDPEFEKGQTPVSRIIEDIAVVRRCEPQDQGYSIALELVGLADADIDELVRVTNLSVYSASSRVPEEQDHDDALVESVVDQKGS